MSEMKVTTESAIQPSKNLLATAAMAPMAALINRNRHQSAIHFSILLYGLYPVSHPVQVWLALCVEPASRRPPLVDQLVLASLLGWHCLNRQFDGHPDDQAGMLAVYDFRKHLRPGGEFHLPEDVRDFARPPGGRDSDDGVAEQRAFPPQVHGFKLEGSAGLAEGGRAEDRNTTLPAPEADKSAFGTRIIGDSQTSGVYGFRHDGSG